MVRSKESEKKRNIYLSSKSMKDVALCNEHRIKVGVISVIILSFIIITTSLFNKWISSQATFQCSGSIYVNIADPRNTISLIIYQYVFLSWILRCYSIGMI